MPVRPTAGHGELRLAIGQGGCCAPHPDRLLRAGDGQGQDFRFAARNSVPSQPLLSGDFSHLADLRKPVVPAGVALTPAEIANVVAFVASDEASAITGASIAADCGLGIMFAT